MSAYFRTNICLIYFILFVCFIWGNEKAFGQDATFKFIHYTTKDGLPTSQLYQAYQDTKGYMWFTSDHGLVRYNGYEFKTFTSADGLTDNTVFKIVEDNKNRFWLLTFAGGISVLENNKISPYKFNDLVKKEINGNIPLGIYVDSADNVFVTSHVNGEFCIDKSGKLTQVFRFNKILEKHSVFIEEHTSKSLTIAISAYGDVVLPLQINYKSGSLYNKATIPAIKQRKVHAIRSSDGRRLISIDNSIFEFINNEIHELVSLPEQIYFMYEDSKKRLWVGTSSGFYLFANLENFSNYSNYLQKSFVSGIHEDKEGGVWLTTLNNGIYYLANDQIKNFIFEKEILREPLVLSTDNKSQIYVGYWSGAVATLERNSLLTINESDIRTEINFLLYDSTSTRLYMGSRVSGYLFKNQFYPFIKKEVPSVPLCAIKSINGNIYFAGDKAFYRIRNDTVFQLGKMNFRINDIYEIRSGLYLLGSNSGAFLFDENTESISLYSEQLKDVRIDDISFFKGYYCFSTRGKGLLLNRNNTFIWINEKDGLASNLVHKAVVSDNSIWCATNNGVCQIIFDNLVEGQFKIRNINARDGLPSNEIHDILILHDTLFVSTSDGLSYFHSKTIFSKSVIPSMFFTSLRVNNIDTLPKAYHNFSYNFNNIRIGFEAPAFKNTSDIVYHYVLTNSIDSIFSNTKIREVDFLSLSPGNYTFSVTAVHVSEGISSKPILMKFTISNPYWQMWWFQLIIILIIAVLVSAMIKRQIRVIKKREETKTAFNKQLIQFEIKALRAQMNPHFIFNVINSIQDYILKNDARSAQKYLTKFARLVRLILDNSIKSEVVLAEELKLAELYIELEQQRFENKFEFLLRVEEEVDTEEIVLPAMIIQPYLENAIKHGIRYLPKQGRLILKIVKRNQSIIITIEDNGVGRAASAESNKTSVREHVSYGTIITSKRIDAYNMAYSSNITAEIVDLKDADLSATGTRIILSVPIKYKQMQEE